MHNFKSTRLILTVMLLFAGQALAGPFLVCEDMRHPVDATMVDGSHCDGMMLPAGHEHDMHDMHDMHGMTAAHDHAHNAGTPMNPEASEHTCTHLCSACLASASLVGFQIPDGINPYAGDAPLVGYQLLLPSAPAELLFRPPIFA